MKSKLFCVVDGFVKIRGIVLPVIEVRFLDDDKEYEIFASPENINRRGQYMRFKVVAIGG